MPHQLYSIEKRGETTTQRRRDGRPEASGTFGDPVACQTRSSLRWIAGRPWAAGAETTASAQSGLALEIRMPLTRIAGALVPA